MPPASNPLNYKPPTLRPGPHPCFLICASLTCAIWIADLLAACDHGQIPWPLYQQLVAPLTLGGIIVALADLTACHFVALAPWEDTLLCIAGLITLPGSFIVPSFFHG
jgi:hypothetical protein